METKSNPNSLKNQLAGFKEHSVDALTEYA
jgi:hypothetical protein